LQTIPGVGKILALVMLYEIQDISRFERVQNFSSYARLIKPQKESAGKVKGAGNRKMGLLRSHTAADPGEIRDKRLSP